MATKKIKEGDPTTEEKIKNAARLVFYKKGFAATRTRDIAEEAGINLALLNYYFRSKEKLFDIIMLESMQLFLQTLGQVLNNEKSSLDSKIEKVADGYVDILSQNPELPLFVLSELRTHPEELIAKMGLKKIVMQSFFLKQLQQEIKKGSMVAINPLHFIMNLMGLTVFPFVASPMIKGLGGLSQKEFNELMEQRRKLIPKWIKAMLQP